MERQPAKTSTTKNHYVQNDKLVEELKKSRANGRPTEKLSIMFKLIAQNRTRKFPYKNEDDRKDCVSTAVEIMLKKFDKFDLERNTNAFSYYSQVAINGLFYGWNQLNSKAPVTYSIDQIFSESV